jgi:hypothetical protein
VNRLRTRTASAHPARLADALLQGLALLRAPQVGRGDAVVVDHQARLAAGQQGEQAEQRVGLPELGDDEVGVGEEGPRLVRRLAGPEEAGVRPDGGVEVAVGFDEDAGVGAAVEEEGELLGDLVADGVAGLGVVAEQCDSHGVPP